MVDLANLYFGFDDAERDFSSGLLNTSFVETSFYRSAKDGKKELILGRKGTGKSAVCLMLKQSLDKEGFPTFLITPDAISLSILDEYNDLSSNTEESMRIVWQYVLLVNIAKYLLVYIGDGCSQAPSDVRKKLLSFLQENSHIEAETFFRRIGRKIGLLKKVSFKAFGVELGVEKELAATSISIGTALLSLQNLLSGILAQWSDAPRLFLLLDKLDDIWGDTDESDSKIIGLIRACREISTALPEINASIFLRSDIFDTLEFHDYDKYHGIEEMIDWSREALLTMICRRIGASTNTAGSDLELWESVFTKKVEDENSFSYMVSRTLCRPRDLIQFCNLCREYAERRSHSIIEERDIKDAERRYSEWKLQDLVIEYRINYPFLKDLLIGFKRRPPHFPSLMLLVDLENSKRLLAETFPQLADINPKTLAQLLYRIGFLGAGTPNGEKFFYDDPTIDIESEDTLVIHPCFRSALDSPSHDDPSFASAISSLAAGSTHDVSHPVTRMATFNAFQIRSPRGLGWFEAKRDSLYLKSLMEKVRGQLESLEDLHREMEDQEQEQLEENQDDRSD